MSTPSSCCNPCAETEVTEIPGIQGDPGVDGTNGTDGINAYTLTTDDGVNSPAVGDSESIEVANNTWMKVGQIVFIEGWGYYKVLTTTGTTIAEVENMGYSENAAPATPIVTGAGVTPGGTEPTISGFAEIDGAGANSDITSLSGLTTALSEGQGGTGRTGPVTPISTYATGAAFVIPTTTQTLIVVGGTDADIDLDTPGTWLVQAILRLDLNAVTNGTASLVTANLFRSNNTPANVTNAQALCHAPQPVTAITQIGARFIVIPPMIYKTPNSNDNLQVRIAKSANVDTSGTYEIGNVALVATWLNSETA